MIDELTKLGFYYIGETTSYCSKAFYNYEKDILIYESKGLYEFADNGLVIGSINEVINILSLLPPKEQANSSE